MLQTKSSAWCFWSFHTFGFTVSLRSGSEKWVWISASAVVFVILHKQTLSVCCAQSMTSSVILASSVTGCLMPDRQHHPHTLLCFSYTCQMSPFCKVCAWSHLWCVLNAVDDHHRRAAQVRFVHKLDVFY